MPLANTPALLLRNAMRASVGSSAVSSITALREREKIRKYESAGNAVIMRISRRIRTLRMGGMIEVPRQTDKQTDKETDRHLAILLRDKSVARDSSMVHTNSSQQTLTNIPRCSINKNKSTTS
jgi:hypothetical protein